MKKLVNRGSEDFVRDSEGAKRACMSIGTFRRLGEEFGAVYRVGRTRLTSWPKFMEGMENYRV